MLNNKPWAWVPSTYIMEGIPGTLFMVTFAIMFKDFGMDNAKITMIVGLITIPYTLKPLWASFVDIFFTKKSWIYITEILLGALIILFAISLQASNLLILSMALLWSSTFLSATHDIATDGFYMLGLKSEEQAFFQGIRSACYQIGAIFSNGIVIMSAGILFNIFQNHYLSWGFVLTFVGLICICIGIYNFIFIPNIETKKDKHSFKQVMQEFITVYTEFFKLKKVWYGILFLLFFAISETSLSTIAPLFLKDSVINGGLNLSDQFIGFVYGVLAILAILTASILGGLYIYKKGLKDSLWTMLIIFNLGHINYLLLATYQPENHLLIAIAIVLEKFLFAFGYAAYGLFIIYIVKDSKFKTAHFAFLASVMIFIKIPFIMISGYIQMKIGYINFFIYVLLLIIPAIFVVYLVDIEKSFAKKTSK